MAIDIAVAAVVIKLVACKVDGGVVANSDRCGRSSVTRQTIVSAVVELISNIALYFGIALSIHACERNRILITITIIRRLRSALGSRVIRQRGRPESIVASFVALGLVAILVFGIPVVGVFYISRLT